MDPATITASVLALLLPYAKKSAESFAGELGKAAFAKIQALLATLKSSFASDAPAKDTVARFERDPDKYSVFLADVLTEKFQADEALRRDVLRIVKEIRALGPTVRVVQEMQRAEDVTGVKAKRIASGDVDVGQTIDEGKNIKGVEADEIG